MNNSNNDSKEEIEFDLMKKKIERFKLGIKIFAGLYILSVIIFIIFIYFVYTDSPTLIGFGEGLDPIWSK